LMYGQHIKEMSGAERHTTNNKMELQAAISALSTLKEACKVTLYSDSAYLVNCFKQGWYKGWLKNGWKNSKGQPVENQDLWKELLRLMEIHLVEYVKVKGHADNKWNNRCDELATGAIKQL